MKKKKYPVNYQDFQELREMGYVVLQCEPWHYKVFKDGEKNLSLDIYPTTRVYVLKGEDREYLGKGDYKDVLELVETKLDYHATNRHTN